jgi:hypothetical protein
MFFPFVERQIGGLRHNAELQLINRQLGRSIACRLLEESKEFIQQSDERLARYVQCDQSRSALSVPSPAHGDFSVYIIALQPYCENIPHTERQYRRTPLPASVSFSSSYQAHDVRNGCKVRPAERVE